MAKTPKKQKNGAPQSDAVVGFEEKLWSMGYPPDKQEAATTTVLQQAELLSDFWLQTNTAAV